MKARYVFGILILLFFSCKKNNTTEVVNPMPSDTAKLFEYIITPSNTNPNILTFNNPHEVFIDTRTTLKNKLFLFLPGTTGTPYYYKLILKKAASLGFHAIGLMYPNGSDLYTSSSTSSSLDEFGKCRQEIFDGSDQTTGINVDVDNSIKSRLIHLLSLLDAQYPKQGWSQFLINNDISWINCIIAGHSQGGGHAFFIAKQQQVDRAISFSSIDWNSSLSRSASWVTQAGATPINKFYSFNGIKDQIFSYANVQTQLVQMGIQGPAISIDNNTPPYNNSHTLTTNATAAVSVLFPDHNITSLDSYVPKDFSGNAIPSFDNAWEYLLTQ